MGLSHVGPVASWSSAPDLRGPAAGSLSQTRGGTKVFGSLQS
jgi:hypothetical protein